MIADMARMIAANSRLVRPHDYTTTVEDGHGCIEVRQLSDIALNLLKRLNVGIKIKRLRAVGTRTICCPSSTRWWIDHKFAFTRESRREGCISIGGRPSHREIAVDR